MSVNLSLQSHPGPVCCSGLRRPSKTAEPQFASEHTHACAHFTHTKNSKHCREDTMWAQGGRGGERGGGGGEGGQRHPGGLTVEVRHEWLCLQRPEGASRALSHLARVPLTQRCTTLPRRTQPSLQKATGLGWSIVISTRKAGAFIRTDEWRKTNLQSIIMWLEEVPFTAGDNLLHELLKS